MKKIYLKIATMLVLFTLLTAVLSSCSVAMAANKSGADVTEVQAARTRGQILAIGAKIVSTDKDASGNLIETYTIQKEKGSMARAFMHGVLDVSTLGIWEAVGTPIEGTLCKKEYFSIRVLYDHDENIKHVELI